MEVLEIDPIQEKTNFDKKRSLLYFLLPLILIETILGTVFGVTMCKNNPGGTPIEGYIINAEKADEVASEWNMYDEGDDTAIEIPKSINLKELGKETGDNIFVLEGTINHTIFIPSDFSCWLVGANGSKIIVDDDNIVDTTEGPSVCGVIIGNDEENKDDMNVGGDIKISDNVISSSSASGMGMSIFLNATIFGTLAIDNNTISSSSLFENTPIIFNNKISSDSEVIIENNTIYSVSSSSDTCSFYFNDTISGTLDITNNIISSYSPSYYSYGIYFSQAILSGIIDIVSNTISVSSSSSATYNILFKEVITSNSEIKIEKNTTSCSSTSGYGYDIYFIKDVSYSIIIIADNTISSFHNIYVLYFAARIFTSSNVTIVNNIISSYSASSSVYGMRFDGNVVGDKLIISNNTISSVSTSATTYAICFIGSFSAGIDAEIFENTILSSSSSTARGINFNSNTPIPTGHDNVFYWNGTGKLDVTGYLGNDTFFPIIKQADSFKFGSSTWNDVQSNPFTFKLYYPIGTTNSIPDQKQALIDKMSSYEYTNLQSVAIVNGFIWDQTF